ncbi:MAG TPA: sulfatase [Acidobacteriota bacterium]|nr:sulfatase [Acidobacteriota bacterium]
MTGLLSRYDCIASGKRGLAAVLGLILFLAACGRSESDSIAVRLVDEFSDESVEGRLSDVEDIAPLARWDFSSQEGSVAGKEANATLGWTAASGIQNLGIREGRLAGVSTSDFPLLHFAFEKPIDDRDLIHAIEIRLRASGGANLSIRGDGPSEQVDIDRIIEEGRQAPWPTSTPIVAGDSLQTYTIRLPFSQTFAQIGHFFVRPTDVAGETFEIESVHIVSRKEHLSLIPSGIGWQGLSEVYMESLVARAPETIHFEVSVPRNPVFHLQVGTVEDGAVTFAIRLPDRSPDLLVEHTVTTPHRWEAVPLDLSPFSGGNLRLALSIEAEKPGTLGFWGNPVIRNQGVPSPAAIHRPDRALQLPAASAPPQGVIIFLADTLRRDHLNFYGYGRETAPILSETAAGGALFLDAISQASWTKVSVPSIVTSLYPRSHRIKDAMDRLPATTVTLAEIYRTAGFATIGYSSVPFTGKMTNLHQGFEELHERGSIDPDRRSKTARKYIDHFSEWMARHKDVPFYAFVQVFDPHDPFEPYRPYNTLWADPAHKEEHEASVEKVKQHIVHPLRKDFGMPRRHELEEAGIDPERYVDHDKDWYDGSIRGMDVEFGRLLQRLRTLGLEDKVVIAFISDHGEEFLEHDWTFHGQSVYGELINVPLFLYGPSFVPPGPRIDETVRNIDLMPTLLELSHLEVPDSLQGQSLLPLLSAAARGMEGSALREEAARLGWEPRPAIAEKAKTIEGRISPPPNHTESVAIILDGWKLIHNTEREEGHPEVELYNHLEDPLNQHNLAESRPEIVQMLKERLASWKEMAEAAQLPDADETEGLDPEELKRLRSLGYIQ